ncbi:nebulette isoform X4 [Tamandua tetradactyla]|uniref:nebulette isoform X4 n=1 Tax=Tamandua tetradactyla TaxID=48850 RepID=UPI0040546F2B
MKVPVCEDLKDGTEEENAGGEENEDDMVFWKPVIEDLRMELARKCTKLNSDIQYKEEYRKSKDKCSFVTDTPMLAHVKNIGAFISEAKYKGTIKADLSNSLYKQMPATIDSVFAREVTQLQSEVVYKEKHSAAKGVSDYARMREPPEVKHAMEISKQQSEVSYRKDARGSLGYSARLDRPDIRKATQLSKAISNAEYKRGQGEMNKEPAVIGRPDFEHAVEASRLSSQIKYKEKFDNEMKDKKHQYNPLESASFRQSQLGSVLASDVKYRKDIQNTHDPVSGLPNLLFLDHVLKASKMLSGREYKKVFEENKGMYHFDTEATEHVHHRGNTRLLSQVKYKEEYEKNKGKSMLEFVETPSYQASKEAQMMQSEKVYREDFEKELKGKPSLDLDKTPEFLHVKYITSLLKEKEYKKDLENEIKGKGMELNSEVLDIQRAKRASEMASEVKYKDEMQRVTAIADPLELRRAKETQKAVSNLQYKELCSRATPVSTTPELERAQESQRQLSAVKYRGATEQATAIRDPPELRRARENQKIISDVYYKGQLGRATAVSMTPEMQRVKKNQENISSVRYTRDQQRMRGRPSLILGSLGLRCAQEAQEHVSMVKYHEDFEKTKGRGFTPVMEEPGAERTRRDAQLLDAAAYKGARPHVVGVERRPGFVVDLKVWRTDPGSVFDLDPLEDDIQSRSLHMLSEKVSHPRRCQSQSQSSSTFGVGLGDERSELSGPFPSISGGSDVTRLSEEGAPVLPGAYQQSHSPGYGYMHPTSMASMRPTQHSPNLRTYRAMYDYSAQDEDEVSFRDGDYIVNVQPIDAGWMYGTVQRTGKSGMLPANYIEAVN